MQNDKIKGVTQARKQPFYKNTDHMPDACAYTDQVSWSEANSKTTEVYPFIITKLNNIIQKLSVMNLDLLEMVQNLCKVSIFFIPTAMKVQIWIKFNTFHLKILS